MRELVPDALGSDLLRTLTRKSYAHELYRQGAIVPALGVEEGTYTVSVRSTETEGQPLPLGHRVFSTGFVLGSETGELLLCSLRRLQAWRPGRASREDRPLESEERTVRIAPGWYQVTVVAGVPESRDATADDWVCAFLLEPHTALPHFRGDLQKLLTL